MGLRVLRTAIGPQGIPSLGTWAFFARSGLESTKRNKSHATRSAEHWWLYLLYVSIFWRSCNLRLFLVHHKKWFLHLRSLQQSSCIYRASPKNISWNLWCLEQLFWKINNNILESYWTHRFPTLYQTTILGTRWDLEDTRVINIKKSCQANYQ